MSVSVEMINLKKHIEHNKIDTRKLALVLGLKLNILSRYINGTKCNIEVARKTAKELDVTLDYLTGKEIPKPIEYTTPCFNELCPLCKNHICVNDVVLTGRADCVSKDKVAKKPFRNKSENLLMMDRREI